MRTSDELLEKGKKKTRAPVQEEPDEVEVMMELPAFEALDTAKSVFDRGAEKLRDGINTRKSVFDRQAKFRPQGQDD